MTNNTTTNPSAESLRDKGINNTLSRNYRWSQTAIEEIEYLLTPGEEIIGEEIRERLTVLIGDPNHPNAWGALIMKLARSGFIEQTGRVESMKAEKSHARKSLVWRVI